ncbi:MAG TPA: polysaccharide deacetylase family protein [Rhizobiales bacterium]|nr:polysaccharide deacetylase family protein [Hyphomicrobiales bacterium]
MRLVVFLALLIAATGTAYADPFRLVEPALRLPASTSPGAVRVALTLDACGGGTDMRILSALVENRIPATIFVTGIWLRRNAEVLAVMKAHPDLFEIENHGARHVPAIDRPASVYGIAAAGSAEAVGREVLGGADALRAAGLPEPRWFRGATAKYTPTAMARIESLGFRVAGYSLNADGGSLLGAAQTERRVEAARDSDVVLAHINQPKHAAGGGLVAGLLTLKARGVGFARLKDVDGATWRAAGTP